MTLTNIIIKEITAIRDRQNSKNNKEILNTKIIIEYGKHYGMVDNKHRKKNRKKILDMPKITNKFDKNYYF